MASTNTPLHPGPPSYSQAELAENPWLAIELKLYDIIAASIKTDDELSRTSAAQQLNVLFPTNRPGANESPESFLWELWGVVGKFAGGSPHEGPHQDRLVELLETLRGLPNPIDLNMENWGPAKLWVDLPLLGPVLRETLDTDQGVNFEAFLARLTQSEVANWSWLGLVAFHNALEVEPDARSRAYKEQGPSLDAQVPRAIMWLKIAGKKIYEEVEKESLKEEAYGSGGNWKGPGGFSKERWSYWKKRFEEIGVHEQANENTKDLAKKGFALAMQLEK